MAAAICLTDRKRTDKYMLYALWIGLTALIAVKCVLSRHTIFGADVVILTSPDIYKGLMSIPIVREAVTAIVVNACKLLAGEIAVVINENAPAQVAEKVLSNKEYVSQTMNLYRGPVAGACKATASGLATLVWITDLGEDIASTGNIQAIIKPSMKYIVAIGLIQNANTIITSMNEAGSLLVNKVSWSTRSHTVDIKDLAQKLADSILNDKNATLGGIVLSFLLMFILGSVMVIAYRFITMMVWGMCFGVVIELAACAMMSPLGVAWFAQDGIRGPGMRFLKAYFAIWIKAALMIAVASMSSVMMDIAIGAKMGTSPWEIVMICIACFYACIPAMKATGEIGRRVMGV